MSTLFIDRFVSSLYNEKIKINNEFDVDEKILDCNRDVPLIPSDPLNKPKSYPNYPTEPQNSFTDFYNYELNRYINGNMKTVNKDDFNVFKMEENDRIKFLKKFALRKLIIDKLFGTTYRNQIGNSKRTIFLFPCYETTDESKDKLLKDIADNYKWIFDLPDLIKTQYRFFLDNQKDFNKTELTDNRVQEIQENLSSNEFYFAHNLTDNSLKNNPLFPNNGIIFLPVMKENENEDEFEKRISSFLTQVKDLIVLENNLVEGQIIREQKLMFNSISYAVIDDKENDMFTDYYEGFKLSSKKKKILKSLLDKTFYQGSSIGKQTIQINTTKKIPFDNLIVEQAEKELISFTKTINSSLIQSSSFINFKEKFIYLINLFKEYSKRSSNLEYSILATSESNTNYLRVFYRVNNMDIPVSVDLIKTGTNYLYKLAGIKIDTIETILGSHNSKNYIYIGFLYKNKNTPNKNVYRFQLHRNKTRNERSINDETKDEPTNIIEDIEDDTEQQIIEGKSVMLELMKNKITGEITFKKSGTRDTKGFGLNYQGKVEEYEILHIYEKYRWFRFNHIDGSLSDETNIRFFPDILFDRKTFIEFLKFKKMYDEKKTRIPYEFLKINRDINLLLEYSNFLQENYSSTHIFKSSLIGRFTSTSVQELQFENSIKSGILDIIFTPINVIYIGKPPKKSIEDKDTSKNYKIVSYQEYKPSGFSELLQDNIKYQYGDFYQKTLEQVISGEDEEYKYCDLHKINTCEIMKEFFTTDYLTYLENKEKLKLNKQIIENISNNKKNSVIQKIIEEIEKNINNFERNLKDPTTPSKFIGEKTKPKNLRQFINNPTQHISMAIVDVTQEDINPDNFKSFLSRNKCKTIRKNIKYDLKKIKKEITIPFHRGIMIFSNGGKTIKKYKKIKNNDNKKKDIFNIKKIKNKKIKPYKHTKKILYKN